MYPLIVTVWALNSLAFIFVAGTLAATYRRGATSTYALMKLAATLAGVTAGSAFLWAHDTQWSRGAACWLAAAPLLIIVGSYGIFTLVVLLAASSGRGRWN
jgi:hypothetical protein